MKITYTIQADIFLNGKLRILLCILMYLYKAMHSDKLAINSTEILK